MHGRNNLAARRQQFGNPLGRTGRPLQLTDHFAEGAESTADDQAVEHEGRQLTAGNTPGDHIHATDPEHHPDSAKHQHDHQGDQPGALEDALARHSKGRLDGCAESLLVTGLVVVGLHGLDLAQGFSHVAADVGDPVLALPRQAAHASAENQDRRQHQRQGQHHDTGELGVGDKQQDDPAQHHQGIAQE
ncbi:hypothetical protein D3C80_774810 [compost metagenome]